MRRWTLSAGPPHSTGAVGRKRNSKSFTTEIRGAGHEPPPQKETSPWPPTGPPGKRPPLSRGAPAHGGRARSDCGRGEGEWRRRGRVDAPHVPRFGERI